MGQMPAGDADTGDAGTPETSTTTTASASTNGTGETATRFATSAGVLIIGVAAVFTGCRRMAASNQENSDRRRYQSGVYGGR